MEFGPIWRSALRNKTGALLVIMQVAFTMALVLNSIVIIQERARLMARPSGLDETNTFHMSSEIFDNDIDFKLTVEEDLRQIRAMPGVDAAVQINAVPLTGSGWSMALRSTPDEDAEDIITAVYMVDEFGVDALGVNLIAGEPFTSNDVRWREQSTVDWPDKAIVSEALAERLFPGDAARAVGRVVYINQTEPLTIVGVMERLQAPWNGWIAVEQSMLVPEHFSNESTAYLIRTEPGQRDSLMPSIEAVLAEREQGRIIQRVRTMEETRARSYELNRGLIKVLGFTLVLLIAITSLGIAGLTSFNVARRTKQIGTRRALGASRQAILRYFLLENLLFTSIGIALGLVFAVAVNIWLVQVFNVPRMSWYLIPAGALSLWLIGLLAVLAPARRAARVAPAVATRTV